MNTIRCQKCGQLKRKDGRHTCATFEQLSNSHKGTKASDETKKKMALAQKGRKHSEETKQKMALWHIGRPRSEETKKKLSASTIKRLANPKNHPNWKGGITPENKRIRQSPEYKLWRISVFTRDNFTCIWCGAKSEKGKFVMLNADHIKPFAYFPELRFAIDNGRTLCVPCHKTTDTFMGRMQNYKIIVERI